MESFPAYIPLEGARVVVVGDGEAADAKVRLFEGSPVRLKRVAEADALSAEAYEAARLVFIALKDLGRAEAAATLARDSGAIVNVVDRPQLSDFVTPSIVDRGAVVGAIGTGGAAPVLATLLRGELEARWPEGLGRLAVLSRLIQAEVRTSLPGLPARRAFWRRLMAGPAAQAALDGDMEAAERLARAAISSGQTGEGRLWLLASPPDPGRLTLAALRALGSADRIVAGSAAPAFVLSYARRDATRAAEATREEVAAWVAAGEAVLAIDVDEAGLEELGPERLP